MRLYSIHFLKCIKCQTVIITYLTVPTPCHLSLGQQTAALSLPNVQKQIGGSGASPLSRQMLSNIYSSVSAFHTTPSKPPNRQPWPAYFTPLPTATTPPGWTRLAICFMGFTCSVDRRFGIFGKVDIGNLVSLNAFKVWFFRSCAPKQTGSPSVELLGWGSH